MKSLEDFSIENLKYSKIKNAVLNTKINVNNIIYINMESHMSNIWECHVGFCSYENKIIVGEEAKISFQYKDNDNNKLNVEGIITYQSVIYEGQYDEDLNIHKILIQSKLFLLHKHHNNRVFNNQNVKNIIQTLLLESKLKISISLNNNPEITICQFNESNMNLFNKICNKLGIFYFHDFDNNTLIISDNIGSMKRNNNIKEFIRNYKKSYILNFRNVSLYSNPDQKINTINHKVSNRNSIAVDNTKDIYI